MVSDNQYNVYCLCYNNLCLLGTLAEELSQGIYNILSGNEVFYADTTLACATSGTSQPQWSYKENQDASVVSLSSTIWRPVTGISTLTITTTQQGYYTCTPIAGGVTYTIAIFNPDVTISKLSICMMLIKGFLQLITQALITTHNTCLYIDRCNKWAGIHLYKRYRSIRYTTIVYNDRF